MDFAPMKLQHVSPKRSDLKGIRYLLNDCFFFKALQPKGLCLRVKCAPCLERVVVNHQSPSLAPTDEAPKKWVLKKTSLHYILVDKIRPSSDFKKKQRQTGVANLVPL